MKTILKEIESDMLYASNVVLSILDIHVNETVWKYREILHIHCNLCLLIYDWCPSPRGCLFLDCVSCDIRMQAYKQSHHYDSFIEDSTSIIAWIMDTKDVVCNIDISWQIIKCSFWYAGRATIVSEMRHLTIFTYWPRIIDIHVLLDFQW